MKNKGKKILAGVAFALTLMCGGVFITGCSNELTQEQMDKVLTVVDNSDIFMEQTLDLLKKNNKVLDAQQALKLYEYSMNRIILNKDNIWDNMKINFNLNNDEKERCEQHYFKLQNGINVTYKKYHGNIIDYYDSTIIAGQIDDKITHSFDYYASTSFTNTVAGVMSSFSEENVVFCKVSEIGDYEISLSTNELFDIEGNNAIVDIVISSDAYLKSIKYFMMLKNYNPNETIQDANTQFMEMTYEYGALNETEVQANIDFYNSK